MSRTKVVPIKKPNPVYKDPKSEETRILLDKLLSEYGVSLKQLAGLVEFARSTITQFHNGTYPSPQNIARDLLGQLQGVEQRLGAKADEAELSISEDDIFESRAFKRAHQVFNHCREQGELGVITGHAGVGKTIAVKAYAKGESDVIIVEANVTFGRIGCLKVLAEALGLDPYQHSLYLLEQAAKKLPTRCTLLIIDEADQLNYPGLEILRTIFDKCAGSVGMVLSGMPRLYYNMTTGRRGGQDLTQLYSRVAVFTELPMPNKGEVKAFIRSKYKGKVPSEAIDVLYQEAAMHGMRRLAKLLPGAIEVAKKNDTTLSAEVVEAARDAFMMVV